MVTLNQVDLLAEVGFGRFCPDTNLVLGIGFNQLALKNALVGKQTDDVIARD